VRRLKELWRNKWTPAFVQLCALSLIFGAVVWSQGTNVAGVGGSTNGNGAATVSTNYTIFPTTAGTSFAAYSPTGTNYVAINNTTGNADFSGTDAGVVIRAAINAKIATCGEVDFKSGIYNINSLVAETTGGFTQSNAILIPALVAANQYCQWHLHGEVNTPAIDQFTTPAGTTGVIFNITAAAISSVSAGTVIFGIWARPDVANGVGVSLWADNFDVRFPTNQRGNETAIDMTQALNTHLVNVTADTAVAQINLQFPVAGTAGLYGITTTRSSKEENLWEHVFVIGYDHCLDIQSEHVVLTNTFAVQCDFGIDLGVRGTNGVTAPNVLVNSGCTETAKCLTLGTLMQVGTIVTTDGFTFEDQAVGGLFVPVYHAAELNVGASSGLFSYSNSIEGSTVDGIYGKLPTPFDGGGGPHFTLIAPGSSNFATIPGTDSFNRTSNSILSSPWIKGTLSASKMQITGGAASINGTGVLTSNEVFTGKVFNDDQFSKITISTMDVAAGTIAEVTTNNSTTAITYYTYYCSRAAALGSGIAKVVAGATIAQSSQTAVAGCNATDTIEIRRIKQPNGNVAVYGYHNGLLDTNFTPNPLIDTSAVLTGGFPGIELAQDATAAITVNNFVGGNPPTVHGTDSLYSTDAYASNFISTGTAPVITGTGACATITTQVGVGSAAGSFKCTGATAASTMTLTFAEASANGYRCPTDDETTVADRPSQTSYTTTSCVLTSAAIVQNDILTWSATPF
jgi:hypothetical protein